MLWNLAISAAGIAALVRHDGIALVLDVLRAHLSKPKSRVEDDTGAGNFELTNNALGVLRNIADSDVGGLGILRSAGVPLLLLTLERYAGCTALVDLGLECLCNICGRSARRRPLGLSRSARCTEHSVAAPRRPRPASRCCSRVGSRRYMRPHSSPPPRHSAASCAMHSSRAARCSVRPLYSSFPLTRTRTHARTHTHW